MISLATQDEVDDLQRKMTALALYLNICFHNKATTNGWETEVRMATPITPDQDRSEVTGTTIYD